MKKVLLILAIVLCTPMIVWAASGKATIKGTASDSKLEGIVELRDTGVRKNTDSNIKGGLVVNVHVWNVPPGKHGFHIHENGSCDDMGKAAGGHYNPEGVMHGYMPKDGAMHAHAGDMGNIDVAEDGTGSLKVFMPGITLKDGKHDVLGKAIILHDKADDFGQPVGNAGGRIGCGIIEEAESQPVTITKSN